MNAQVWEVASTLSLVLQYCTIVWYFEADIHMYSVSLKCRGSMSVSVVVRPYLLHSEYHQLLWKFGTNKIMFAYPSN